MNKIKEGDIFETQVEFSTSGNANIKVEGQEIFIHKKKTANSLHMDTVRVEIFQGQKKVEGKVLEVVSRFKTEFVGTAQVKNDTIFVVTDSPRISVDFYIKGDSDVENGQKVLVEFLDWEIGKKSPRGKIIKILGFVGENNTEMNAIMYEYGLPIDFPQEALNEAELVSEVISEKEISKRKDLRNVTTIGIDPFDSKDADDTISLEFINGKRYISINIADVTHYIKPETELDKEAYKRGTSVYLVDRCVPMLPHRLSNGICSLKSGADRLCYTATMCIDDSGKIKEKWFGRTIINVDKDYSYEQAQEVIENGGDGSDTDSIILELDKIAKVMRKRRIKEGSIEMGGKEVKFDLDENGKPLGVYFKEQKDANKLIEEYMLLANKEVAKFIKSKELPCVNRVHPTPDDEKLIQLKKIATNFGYELEIGDPDTTKMELNKLLKDIKDTPEENIISTLVIRSMKKAYYSTEEIGHYGLDFEDYSHFTSPIRRYSDVLTHRLLTMALGNDGYPKNK
jgi:ribonuclease R